MDKVLHFLAGGGIFLSVSLSFDLFGGKDVQHKETVMPAYFLTLGVAVIKEADDEFRAPLSNDAKEHALDIGATLLGAGAAHAGLHLILSAFAKDSVR